MDAHFSEIVPSQKNPKPTLKKAGQENHDENIANRPLWAKPQLKPQAFIRLSKLFLEWTLLKKKALSSSSFSVKVNLEVGQMMNRAPFGP